MVRDRVRSGVMTINAKWNMVPTATKKSMLMLVKPAKFALSYFDDTSDTYQTGQFYASIEDVGLTSNVDGGYWSLGISFVEY